MLFSLITSWQIDGEKVEMVIDFISLGPKITADSDSAMKLNVPAPWKNSSLKGRDNTLLTEVHTVKTMVFPVVMYGYEVK